MPLKVSCVHNTILQANLRKSEPDKIQAGNRSRWSSKQFAVKKDTKEILKETIKSEQ